MASSREQETPLRPSTSSASAANSHKAKGGIARPARYFLLTWNQELLACIAFVGTLIALFATLDQYRDKPSPDWPEWLSLNSIIAIYMVLLKSCVLLVASEGLGQLKWTWFAKNTRPLYDLARYDNATRGPWGAAKLVWRLQTKHLLASLGALIVLLTLLVDPAAQQIVHFYSCQVVMDEVSASVPRTATWSAGGSRAGPGEENMVPEVKRAIDAAIAGWDTPMQAQCLTGNCTWTAEYNSLAWSGFCTDISDQLVRTKNSSFGGAWNRTVWKTTTSVPGGISVNMTEDFAYSPITYAAMGAAPYEAGLSPNSLTFDFVLPNTGLPSQKHVDVSPVGGFRWGECLGDDKSRQVIWKCRGYGAARCHISPAVNRYNASVRIGQLHETVTDSSTAWGSDDNRVLLYSLDTKCVNDHERSALLKLGYVLDPGQRFIAYNATSANAANIFTGEPLRDTFPDSLVKHGCQYSYWSASVRSIEDHIGALFSGNVSGVPYGTPFLDPSALDGPAAVQAVYNFGDVSFERVDGIVRNLTRALSNVVRVGGMGDVGVPALGQVNEEKTCIQIRWAWMAYPAALVVLSLAFFVWMVVETRPRGVIEDAWKSSPLALLYHGLAMQMEDGRSQKETLERVKEMETQARETAVRLGRLSGRSTALEVH